jgi:hypothetical protein
MPPTTTARKSAVSIIYNGVARDVAFNPNQAVQALLEHALKEFGIPQQNADGLALFTVAGNQLPLDVSCQEAGIESGEQLALRPAVVRGG